MAAQFVKHFVQDLQQDIKIRQCGTIVFNADNLSNVIEIELYNGTEAYSGGGTVSCSVIAPDGATVPVTGGTLTGNVVSVTLTGDCFAIPGQIGVGVQVVNGTQKTTVLKAIYNVELLDTDTVVDPGSRLTTSVADLVSDIEDAIDSIPADLTDLLAAIAPTFSNTKAYTAGQYVWQDGKLYRFTANHAAGSWTGTPPTDATLVALGNDVYDLKSAVENLSVDGNMIDSADSKTVYEDFDGYTLQTSSYIDTDGTIATDLTGLCATTGLIDIADVPDTLIVEFGSTVEGYTGRRAIVLKNTDNTFSSWIYSQLPTSFCTKSDGVVTINVKYLKNQGTRSKIGFNLTADDYYTKYPDSEAITHKPLDWLEVGYSQIEDTAPPANLYNKTCSAFGGSTVSGETATITAVSQGIMTNQFESNSNCVRVTAKITFTTPNVHVLLPYYANNGWNYGNLLELDEIESGVEFTFDFDASYYIVYQSAEKFRLIFQTRNETGISDYSGTITITSLSVQSLDTMRQSPYFDSVFERMMEKVFAGIDVAKTMPERTAEIYCNPNGDKVVFGVGANNVLVAIPVVPGKTLFFGNSLLLGMNTSSSNHQYVYGMCATEPSKDYCHLVMDEITDIKSSATYDRVHGAQFETLEPSDSFSTLWNTTANTYTGEPLKNSFTNDLDLIVIQLSDNINTADRRTAFASNVDTLLQNIRTASPNARLLWVYGWFSDADTNALITSACQRWGLESLNIHQYNTTANQGTSGQSYIDGSGQTSTVSDSWITHPGDNGFSAIADAIINKLGID